MTRISFDFALPVINKDLEAIELLIELPLPAELKDFYSKASGSRPYPNEFAFDLNGVSDRSQLDFVYYVSNPSGKDKTLSLSYQIETVQQSGNRFPKQCIPIGRDPGGNKILYYYSGKNKGQVWFWDHDTEVDYENEDPDKLPDVFPNMTLVSRSLDDFLENLNEPDDV